MDICKSDNKETTKKKKKLWTQPYKIIYYAEERKAFVNELSILLNINDENNIVYMENINDIIIQNFMKDNEEKIKLYFDFKDWSYFKRGREETRKFYALIKNIYKHEGYIIYCKKATLKNKDNTSYSTSKFIFYKPNTII